LLRRDRIAIAKIIKIETIATKILDFREITIIRRRKIIENSTSIIEFRKKSTSIVRFFKSAIIEERFAMIANLDFLNNNN